MVGWIWIVELALVALFLIVVRPWMIRRSAERVGRPVGSQSRRRFAWDAMVPPAAAGIGLVVGEGAGTTAGVLAAAATAGVLAAIVALRV
jgi:hypothetical protein